MMKRPKLKPKPKSLDAICAATLTMLRSDPKCFLMQQNGNDGEPEFYLAPIGWRIPQSKAFEIIAMPDIVPGNAGLMIQGPQIWRIAP
jgi:hypothetical protein